jgi:hypothetical protein
LSPGHRGSDLTLRGRLLREQHREVNVLLTILGPVIVTLTYAG